MTGILPKRRFEVIGRDEIYQIHSATLEVLEKTGVLVKDAECFQLLKDAGAWVDGKRRHVRLPESMIKDGLQAAPNRVELYARNPKYNMKLEGRHVHFGTAGLAPMILDLETGQVRKPTSIDVANVARLADALENMHFFSNVVGTSEVNQPVAEIYTAAISLANMEKHYWGAGFSSGVAGAGFFVKMGAAVAGGMDQLRKTPIVSGLGCPVSPLCHDELGLGWLKEFARNGLPYTVLSEPMGGACAPATLAGSLVVMNAEILSGLVIAQLFNRGTPVIYGGSVLPIDMKRGTASLGCPETGLTAAASACLAQHYGLPSCALAAFSDSKVIDVQFGFERAPLILASMAGCNLLENTGPIEAGLTGSYEAMVLDDEFIGMMNRIVRGIEVNEDTLAVKVIERVGPGGAFLNDEHTHKYARTEMWYPKLLNRDTRAKWEQQKAGTLEERARQKAKKLIAEHVVTPLDPAVQSKMDAIIREAEKVILS